MSESEDLGGDSLADLIDDTDGHEVEAAVDEEPTSAIPESAVAEGENIDVSDPGLADIMADDEPSGESAVAAPTAPVPVVVEPQASVSPASADDEQNFRSQVAGLVSADDVENIVLIRRALLSQNSLAPSLADIAADIVGSSLVAPEGDCDFYGNRPGGRAQGWVSGLSFGAHRRAKRFAKF
jgi:hypothetical protein